MIDRYYLKSLARGDLRGRFNNWAAVGIIMVVAAVLASISKEESYYIYDSYITLRYTTTFSSLFALLVTPVLTVGYSRYFLNFIKRKTGELNDLISPFNYYGAVLGSMLWTSLFTLLWSLLFVVPGIIKAIEYSMTQFVLAENPTIGVRNAVNVSKTLTYMRKGQVFSFYISFIGWYILSAVTLGILGVYVLPYACASSAYLYEDLKARAISEGRITADVFTSGGHFNYNSQY